MVGNTMLARVEENHSCYTSYSSILSKIRTVLSKYWTQNHIVGPNLSETLSNGPKHFSNSNNEFPRSPKVFLAILGRFARVFTG